ncbi:N-6 DNA methylase [Micromonospora sp. BRA006-A]|nr:N-6 DNA methylase [Micromonospora sp. BRA006-A]
MGHPGRPGRPDGRPRRRRRRLRPRPGRRPGATLRAAVRAGCTSANGQELDETLARLAGLWLALRDVAGGGLPRRLAARRRVPRPPRRRGALSPPFGASNWGHEELGYDPRWEYGAPPRTEPELAWVQHAWPTCDRAGTPYPDAAGGGEPAGRATDPGGPAAPWRASGRRRAAQRVAAPHGVPLHLWVLRRPAADAPAPARALLVDAGEGDLVELAPRVLAAWRAFTAAPEAEVEEAGFARAVPVIELLDEEVDSPPPPATRRRGEQSGEHVVRTRERLAAIVGDLPALMPQVTPEPDGAAALTPRSASWPGRVRCSSSVRSGPPQPRGRGPQVTGRPCSPCRTC